MREKGIYLIMRMLTRKNAIRIIVLTTFMLIDAAATASNISNSSQEGNPLTGALMGMFGVQAGLCASAMIEPVFVTALISVHQFLFGKNGKLFAIPLDLLLGFFIAGPHFSGMLTWYTDFAPGISLLAGAAAYLAGISPLYR